MAPSDPSQHIGRVSTEKRSTRIDQYFADEKAAPLEVLPADSAGSGAPPEPEYGAVPLWRRAVAFALDSLVVLTLQLALTVIGIIWYARARTEVIDGRDVVTAPYPMPDPWGVDFGPLMTFIGLALFYEVIYIWKRGQTPAKELMKIRVTRVSDGGLPTFNQALRRSLVISVFRLVPGALVLVGNLVAFVNGVTAPFNMRRRSLADYAAGTMTVYYDANKVEGPVKTRRRPNALLPDGMFGSRRYIAGVTGRSEDFDDKE